MNQIILEHIYGRQPPPGMTIRRHEREFIDARETGPHFSREPFLDDLLAYLEKHGWARSGQIAAAIHKPANNITGTLTNLVRSGRAERRGRRRNYEYRLTENGVQR